jgi:L-seryl-tRNA(Ser) seleniumtransferase
MGTMENKLRELPGVDKLAGEAGIKELETIFPRELVINLVRENLEAARTTALQGNPVPTQEDLIRNIVNQARGLSQPSLRQLINASGVVLHTNLGRAPLSEETIQAMEDASRGYNNLEFDLENGQRGSRHSHIESLLTRLSGAEAGIVVNNNAAAVMLGLSVMAKRHEVIVSRGQAVEIGGGFRIPEVMKQSGAKLVEVGTTNCTYIRDYSAAITSQTAALLRVHSSNFRVVGFTHMVGLEELTALGKEKGIAVLDDLGSGCLLDTSQFGLAPEPTIQASIAKGVDIAFFSGDKLLGGPQAGIIVGRKVYIDKIKKHPLVRALRIDKTRLAGLAATLIHYLKGEAPAKIPVWQMISMKPEKIEQRAREWAMAVDGKLVQGESLIGGGSLPGATLPTWLVALGDSQKPALAQKTARLLRQQNPPVVGRINEGLLLLDPRTVALAQDQELVSILKKVLNSKSIS